MESAEYRPRDRGLAQWCSGCTCSPSANESPLSLWAPPGDADGDARNRVDDTGGSGEGDAPPIRPTARSTTTRTKARTNANIVFKTESQRLWFRPIEGHRIAAM